MTTRAARAVRLWALGALAVSSAACGSIRSSHVLTAPSRPPSRFVRVFLEGQGVPPTFQEIAIVQTVGSGPYANLQDVVEGLQERAASLGCSVVVHVRVDTGSTTSSGTGVCGVD